MHDFDYDAMQKKRIARGASHMKRKRKGCTLPSDNLTTAQKRRLNGPVSTYKLDEPMTWESFKAMPEDLQKKYIVNLQETYQASDKMIGKMFGKSDVTVGEIRKKLGIDPIGKGKIPHDEKIIRDAKWDAFCNGVVGGKPGEVKEPEKVVDNIDEFDLGNCEYPEEPEQIEFEAPKLDASNIGKLESPIDILIPEKLDIMFVSDTCDLEAVFCALERMNTPTGKCRIRIEIEAV